MRKIYRANGGKTTDRFYAFVYDSPDLNIWDRIILWFLGHVKK